MNQTSMKLSDALAARPRLRMAQVPTPLEEMPRFSERLGARILVKRDDQTGLAGGGNKARKLEFLIAHAVEMGADTVLTTGGVQSNHARMTAAACRKAGLDCYLVLNAGPHMEETGNLLLDRMFGAHIQVLQTEDPAEATPAMEQLAGRLRSDGRVVYVVPRGGSVPQGATGYAACAVELTEQLAELGVDATHLYLATGSAGTHSGMLAGLAALGSALPVQGVSVSRPLGQQEARVYELTNETLDYLEIDAEVKREAVRVDDRFRGPAYGYPTPETMAAIEIVALDEGLVLDPVYTGKAMAGLIGHAGEGRFSSGDVVIFLHTGGMPALYAYSREVLEAVRSAES